MLIGVIGLVCRRNCESSLSDYCLCHSFSLLILFFFCPSFIFLFSIIFLAYILIPLWHTPIPCVYLLFRFNNSVCIYQSNIAYV